MSVQSRGSGAFDGDGFRAAAAVAEVVSHAIQKSAALHGISHRKSRKWQQHSRYRVSSLLWHSGLPWEYFSRHSWDKMVFMTEAT